ncbi:MAG: GGDEF domain-containing protein [Shewanella sp. CG12_big_fil_rev_8_21_14_0_65_47_15]|nr:GGDEF domain-containing protein [Shewanella sp. CG12_big_fil_rev_8_21_14_0_65_47_15]PIW60583.1 MAG: GGDEF domain-containing protein [Shewanella sp. CG12_big_fil_rev_8_21_14_0_65_47_15]
MCTLGTTAKSLRLACVYGLSLLIIFIVPLYLWQSSTAKPIAEVDWLDVATEGALFVLGMCWLMVIVSVRPSGRVTNLLIAGLSSYCLGCYLDLLDEIFIVKTLPIYNWFEKMPTPVGLLVLTGGLWLWRDEQTVVNRQLQTREQFHREHQLTDSLTLLNDAKAFEHHLVKQLSQNQTFGLLMLDVDNFHQYNKIKGVEEGDRLLSQLALWLSSTLRNQDLVCRYAGDRFVILLRGAIPPLVSVMAEQLQQGIKGFNCSATVVWTLPSPKVLPQQESKLTAKEEAAVLLQLLNQKISQQKEKRMSITVAQNSFNALDKSALSELN